MTSLPLAALDRRTFLHALGVGAAGLFVGVAGPSSRARAQGRAATKGGLDAVVYIHVDGGGDAGGHVTLVCHRSEMGQGVRSTIPVLLADELGARMDKTSIVQADGDVAYGDQNTDGSSSIRKQYEDLRIAAATARTMLIAAAAKQWKVKPEQCTAVDHEVVHSDGKRRLSFGALADEAGKLATPAKKSVKLRPRAELKRIGTELPLVDAAAYVRGSAIYAADVQVPGMLTAVIVRPPVVGGTVKSLDDRAARAVPGVVDVVAMPVPKKPWMFQPRGGVAVVAQHTWAALQGRAALALTWDHGENASYDSTAYRAQMTAAVSVPGDRVRNVGDVDKALSAAAKVIEADYHVPHLAHATMEPPCAVARFVDGACEVWAATQDPQKAQLEVARVLGILPSKVTMHVTFLGGGFGRKSKADFVSEAAWLAKHLGRPVRVQWTRGDDLQHDYFHTVSQQKLTAALDDRNVVTAWRHRTCFPPIPSIFTGTDEPSMGELQQGVLDVPLAVANVRAERAKAPALTRIGWLRSVCNIFHAFAVSSFMDELAHARGVDPKANLLTLLGPPRKVTIGELGVKKLDNYGAPLEEHPVDTARHRAVIEKVTAMSGWDARKADATRGYGLAVHRSFLAYVAVVVAVVKDANGRAHVDEAWVAVDAGTVLNPDRARSQMEGAVIFGTSIALHSAITMKAGAVEQASFRDYRLVRSNDAPREIHVDILASDGPPCGIGEPGVPPVAPAIANAWFALTGERVRELPFRGTALATRT